jgi:hypothetical protein
MTGGIPASMGDTAFPTDSPVAPGSAPPWLDPFEHAIAAHPSAIPNARIPTPLLTMPDLRPLAVVTAIQSSNEGKAEFFARRFAALARANVHAIQGHEMRYELAAP